MDDVTSHCICSPATTVVVLIVFTITGSTEDCSAKRRIRKINTRKSIEMRFKAESYPTFFIITHYIIVYWDIGYTVREVTGKNRIFITFYLVLKYKIFPHCCSESVKRDLYFSLGRGRGAMEWNGWSELSFTFSMASSAYQCFDNCLIFVIFHCGTSDMILISPGPGVQQDK